LYTLPEMQRADAMLKQVFAAANAPENYSGRFYPVGINAMPLCRLTLLAGQTVG